MHNENLIASVTTGRTVTTTVDEVVELFVLPDEDPESPREWDNMGTFYTCERRRYSPDKHGLSPEGVAAAARDAVLHGGVMRPVYKYEHSGVVYSTKPFSCRFDSGLVGYIFATIENILEVFEPEGLEDNDQPMTPEGIESYLEGLKAKALTALDNEVEVYSQYASGDVWGYDVRVSGVSVESCWGIFGQDEAQTRGQEEFDRVVAAAKANTLDTEED